MKSQCHQREIVSSLFAVSLTLGAFAPAMSGNLPSKPVTIPKATIPVKVQPTPAPQANPTTINSQPLVIVPTLTVATLKNFTTTFGQILDLKLTPTQQQKIHRRVSREWMSNLGLRNTVIQTIAVEPQLTATTPADRTQLQTRLIGNLRQQVLDGDTDALWLVSFYDAAAKNWLAPGQPPLTRMASDISADALCFMVNEIMGKSIATPDLQLKNAIATKLAAEYAKVPNTYKQELSRLPTSWLRFKEDDWYQRSDDFREQMRVHWGQNLEAYIPELLPMIKLRRDRLAKLKADPRTNWYKLNNLQRQAVFQTSEVDFQNSIRTIAPVKLLQLSSYIPTMQVARAIGNSPTRYAVKLQVK